MLEMLKPLADQPDDALNGIAFDHARGGKGQYGNGFQPNHGVDYGTDGVELANQHHAAGGEAAPMAKVGLSDIVCSVIVFGDRVVSHGQMVP